MVHSPSKKWEDGVLVERAISTPPEKSAEDSEFVSGTKPYKAPVPTKSAVTRKRVDTAENKAVAPQSTSKKASKS